jgi:hypothetical protein
VRRLESIASRFSLFTASRAPFASGRIAFMTAPARNQIPVPELIETTLEPLQPIAARLRLLSLGRDERDLVLMNRIANQITELSERLITMARSGSN